VLPGAAAESTAFCTLRRRSVLTPRLEAALLSEPMRRADESSISFAFILVARALKAVR